jgi:beta-glucosidase
LRRIGALTGAHRSLAPGPPSSDLSRQIVQGGAVLLKNDAAVLPLNPSSLSSLALIGADPQTQAAFTAALPRTRVATIAPGDMDGALSAARAAQAALIVLGPQADPAEDQLVAAVAAANPRTVVVLERTPAIAPNWVANVPAVLLAWTPSAGTPQAIANLIAGQANPCGKLPVALPAQAGSGELGFAFGEGLSYTAFAYSNLKISYGAADAPHPVTVRFSVRNAGSVGGTEVAQLYLGAPADSTGSPKALVGFVRFALRPGQSRNLAIALSARSFATWSPSYKAWYVAPGSYQAMLGDGSQSIRLTGQIRIVGK